MKITKTQLKKIIKEELGRVMGETVDSIEELKTDIKDKIEELEGNDYPYQTYVDSALRDLTEDNPNPTEEEVLIATISGLEEAFDEGNYERYERD